MKKLQQKRRLQLTELKAKYKNKIDKNNNLKFKPDPAPWLKFLIKEFKNFYYELNDRALKKKYSTLFNKVTDIEKKLKLPQNKQKINYLNLINELEKSIR